MWLVMVGLVTNVKKLWLLVAIISISIMGFVNVCLLCWSIRMDVMPVLPTLKLRMIRKGVCVFLGICLHKIMPVSCSKLRIALETVELVVESPS